MPFKKPENRRKHARVSLCRLVKIQTEKKSGPSEISQTYDISEAGMRFHVTDISSTGFKLSLPAIEGDLPFASLKKGDKLHFRINLDPDHPAVALLGKVAWVSRETVSGGMIRVKSGVEFVDVSEADRKLIQVYVSAFQK